MKNVCSKGKMLTSNIRSWFREQNLELMVQNVGYEAQIFTPGEECLFQRQNVDLKCNKLVPGTKFGTQGTKCWL